MMGAITNTAEALAKIESKINLPVATAMTVSSRDGGLVFKNAGDVMEFAKLMAVSGQAVPPHCRMAPGVCLAVCMQAVEWRMSPFAVANKSYVVNDRVSYESQLIHAVIEQRAPIQGRLRHSYSGTGQKRRCKVWATPKGETEPMEYESPELGEIKPQNSPLWKTKPDLQLFYNASRDWARMYFPDVILGVYADDELVDYLDSQPLPPSIEQVQAPTGGSRTQRLAASVTQHKPPEDIPPRHEQPLQSGPDDDTEEQEPDEQPPEEPQSLAGTPPPDMPESLAKAATDMHRAMTPADVAETFEYWNAKIEDPDDGMAWSDLRDWKLANLPKVKGQGSLGLGG